MQRPRCNNLHRSGIYDEKLTAVTYRATNLLEVVYAAIFKYSIIWKDITSLLSG